MYFIIMNWNILSVLNQSSASQKRDEIITALLNNRGLTDSAQQQAFLHPAPPASLTLDSVGIDSKQTEKAVKRIIQAANKGEPIIIFGDYDADGITATGVLWETLSYLKIPAYPFIPSRDRHGYGLSVKGIEEAIFSLKPGVRGVKPLFVTVDNGIVAYEAAAYLKANHIDLIITDHHQPGPTLPPCYALVHTDSLAGAGVAWMFAKSLATHMKAGESITGSTLDLTTIGTVADMVPLTGANRQLVTAGLVALQKSKRPGLKALFDNAKIEPDTPITTYHINYVIAPRINAMGRLEHALDSLRLLLTTNPDRAVSLAHVLSDTNVTRQDLTQTFLDQAQTLVGETLNQNLIVVDHADFHEGVIGLVAGKLVETYYRPAIVISRGELVSKASVRSVPGVNIIEYLRQFSAFYVNAGGHPMAAGFTIETHKISEFKSVIQADALKTINPELLIPSLTVDCAITLEDISMDLYQALQQLKPFGMANREPVFCTSQCRVIDIRTVGKTGAHLKVSFQAPSGTIYHGIGFNMAKKVSLDATHVDVAYTIEENVWNHTRTLQLHLKDVKP
jgi:single-stranded-DNA-specific exonuclease